MRESDLSDSNITEVLDFQQCNCYMQDEFSKTDEVTKLGSSWILVETR